MKMAEHPRADIDRHFAGSLGPAKARLLHEHLRDCAECRDYFERHQLLAELVPGSLDERARVGRGHGFLTHAQPTWGIWLGAAACAAALMLTFAMRRASATPPELAARGAIHQASTGLEVYRIAAGHSELAHGAMSSKDELAFAYTNLARFEYLMIFGVDEHAHVHWFFPTWEDAAAPPLAAPIERGPELRELPQAVSHDLDGRKLRIYGLFSNRRRSVVDVERELAEAAGKPLASRFEGSELTLEELQVQP